MADFLNPFSGVAPDRKITARELTRAIRLALAAEEEAIHLYEALADSTDNDLARAVLQDVADEERVHAGEFRRLLCILLPDEDRLLAEGAAEVDELLPAGKGSGTESGAAKPRPTIGGLREGTGS